jgi:hypothetical protein
VSENVKAELGDASNPPDILSLIGKGKGCFNSATEVDAFIRAERDAWED